MKGLYSFVEQWVADRAALYGPSFVAETHASDWVLVDHARFSHGTIENHDAATSQALVDFSTRIPCLNTAKTKAQPKSCLDSTAFTRSGTNRLHEGYARSPIPRGVVLDTSREWSS